MPDAMRFPDFVSDSHVRPKTKVAVSSTLPCKCVPANARVGIELATREHQIAEWTT